ncbi:glycosyltransferase [Gilvibacter sediminis]|uniref:glycosyltransferase n=1 Tax=Gilvibacter sediminis TaxID=379071 RepID=UPI002350CC28|nr:glycosyltransferase [Gilvibacter sediminis]MDC7997850.1 glycosyltransferase [Gilvibacter sediminis]
MKREYSFIIPVYNRPEEVDELLGSMVAFESDIPFEVCIIEDGSTQDCKAIVARYKEQLNINYQFKENSGPGPSRNYGMSKASGNYFIILDSDVIMPPDYLSVVDAALNENYLDCFGGADAAHDSFTDLQKAINYSMTSLLTTGGIRGNKKAVQQFEPRSFNMGISKETFIATQGFGKIHPGEDPDLSWRIKKAGFKTGFIAGAAVYHKRRISWAKFKQQVTKFGLVRPILNSWHPESKKITFWFPSLFIVGLLGSLVLALLWMWWFLALYGFYFSLLLIHAIITTGSLKIGFMALWAAFLQFYSYGTAFLISTWQIGLLKKDPQAVFPQLFFK